MTLTDLVTTVCVVLIWGVVMVTCDASCTYTDPSSGKTYNLSALTNTNGTYTWTQHAYVIDGNNIDSMDSNTMVEYTFHLQVCQNIDAHTLPKPCNDTGAIYAWSTMRTECISWGRADASIIEKSTSNEGGLDQYLYHGSAADGISRFSTVLHFICSSDDKMTQPFFNKMNADISQGHFSIFTKYAC